MNDYFIDMHSHILPGVDDGAKDVEEMKKMLQIAYDEGIRCIIATPHHHPHRGRAPVETLKKRAAILRQAAHEIDGPVPDIPGNGNIFRTGRCTKVKRRKDLIHEPARICPGGIPTITDISVYQTGLTAVAVRRL